MKILLNPATQIENAKQLKEIQLNVGVLLKTLKHTYNSSNFYKEARVVSFVDRLLGCIVAKIKQKCNVNMSIVWGIQGTHTDMLQQIDSARSITIKFSENLFMQEMITKHEKANEVSQEEMLKSSGHNEQN